MKFTRHSAAAALLAVCAAFSCVQAAAAPDAPGADAVRGPGGQDGQGGPADGSAGPGERGPFDGPPHHGFGPSGPGAPGPEMPLFPYPGGPMGHLRHLDLSEAQQDKLLAIMHAAAPQQRAQMKAERRAHDALRALGTAPQFDEAKAGAAARDLGQAVAAAALLRARIEAQVLAVLSPEQRERMARHRP